MIQLDINAKLYDLATEHPEIIELMDSLGFHEIKSLECYRLLEGWRQFQWEQK